MLSLSYVTYILWIHLAEYCKVYYSQNWSTRQTQQFHFDNWKGMQTIILCQWFATKLKTWSCKWPMHRNFWPSNKMFYKLVSIFAAFSKMWKKKWLITQVFFSIFHCDYSQIYIGQEICSKKIACVNVALNNVSKMHWYIIAGYVRSDCETRNEGTSQRHVDTGISPLDAGTTRQVKGHHFLMSSNQS